MADDITHTSTSPAGPPNNTKQVTDEHATRGHMPVVKLAYSADGDATPITADVKGLEIQQATAADLNVTEASAAAIKTAVETLDNAIAGTEMQVDVVAALPAGTNAIGKLAANSGIDIGDVDVTSVIPGTGATNLGKAIDTAAGATDTGVAPLAQRDDALGALTPIEGDYVPLRTDANGALWTHDDALDAALGGSELQVDVVAALPAGTNAIGKLAANTGVDIGDVDVLSIAAGDNNIGNVDVVTLPAIPAGSNKIGAVDLDSDAATGAAVPAVGQLACGTDGTNARALKTDAGGELQVDVLTIPSVAQATASSLNAQVVGEVAHDGADSGNPVKVGGKATTDLTALTAVAAADRANLLLDSLGRVITIPYSGHENLVNGATSDIVNTTRTAVIAAGAAGVKTYITHILVCNSHATVATFVNIEDGTTTKYTVYAAAAGGGASITLPSPLPGTAATAWNVSCVTTGANVRVSMAGYQCKV